MTPNPINPESKVFVWNIKNAEDSRNYYSVYVTCKNCGKSEYLHILKGHRRAGYVKCDYCENMIEL